VAIEPQDERGIGVTEQGCDGMHGQAGGEPMRRGGMAEIVDS
jgi:hypothetical protein